MAANKPSQDNTLWGAVGNKLKRYFFTGILVTAPLGLTIYIAWSIVSFVDEHIKPIIPEPWRMESAVWPHIPGLGLVALIVGLTLIGAITTNILGRVVVRASDTVMARTPILRGIYSLLKQMVEMLVGEDKSAAFRQVVLVPYPAEDSWVLGFLTGSSNKHIEKAVQIDLVSVFVPLTPNPTSGFLLYYPKEKIKNLDISVEDGWKLILSTGIVSPGEKKTA